MWRSIIAGALAISSACGSAGAQPEYWRQETGGWGTYWAWLGLDGDVLAWSAAHWPSTQIVTHVYRRIDGVWTHEADLPGWEGPEAFTVVGGDRIVVWGFEGQRIYRHDGATWRREPIDRGSNGLFIGADVIDFDGTWLVVRRAGWPGQGKTGLAYVFHFDGTAWRLHSRLEAQGLYGRPGGWMKIHDGVIAAGSLLDVSPYDGPVSIFRLVDGAWRHEATVPAPAGPMAVDSGRVAINSGAGDISVFTQSAPGVWEEDSTLLPAVGDGFGRHATFDGDRLLTTERYYHDHSFLGHCAAVYVRTSAGWELTRTLFPSNALSLLSGIPSYAFSGNSQVLPAGGEIFVRSFTDGGVDYFSAFPACRADFNGDGVADFHDFVAFLEARNEVRMNVDYDMDASIRNIRRLGRRRLSRVHAGA